MINYLSVQINFYSKEQCALPAKVRRELEFRFFGEGQNIFDLRGRGGGVSSERGLYFVRGNHLILRPFSHFEMQGFFKTLGTRLTFTWLLRKWLRK